ncbi:MAG: HAD family hydrolase [Chloroflexota bacterium]|nr:HAD family hydrolase [Chloroflexota bacterium]
MLAGVAITFDFHNTLATCDRWFDLEVHDLVPAFLRWRSKSGGPLLDADLDTRARVTYRSLRQEVIQHGHEMSAEQGLARVLGELEVTVDEEEIAGGVETLMRACLDEVRPAPGAIETIRGLAEAGVPLGVVSSAVYHPFVGWALKRIGLDSAFGSITTSASAGFYKSRPEIYAVALSALGAAADRSVHVGDSFRFDVQGARRAGMRTAWVQAQQPTPPGEPADLTLPSLHGATESLLSLLNAGSEIIHLARHPSPTGAG